jgi:hypothetical protein
MGDVMRSHAAGRELVRLGRRDGRLPMLPASVSGRLGEAQARWRPAPPAVAGAGAAQACQIVQPHARDRGIDHLSYTTGGLGAAGSAPTAVRVDEARAAAVSASATGISSPQRSPMPCATAPIAAGPRTDPT